MTLKKYNLYNKKLDYTDYTLNIQIIFLCDYTDYIFVKTCHRESHSKMLTESLLERERFDKRQTIVAQKYAQLLE